MKCTRCQAEKPASEFVRVSTDNCALVCRPCVTPEEWAASARADAAIRQFIRAELRAGKYAHLPSSEEFARLKQDEIALEEHVAERLEEAGLLVKRSRELSAQDSAEIERLKGETREALAKFEPIEVKGKPLSQMIIEDRR